MLFGNVFTGDPTIDVLLVQWANIHPYLFTLIAVARQTSMLIVLAILLIKLLAYYYRKGKKTRT